jgi:hypothetical protein
MYYLMDITIYPELSPNYHSVIQRLVKAKNKNEAYDKTTKYLKEIYISNPNDKFKIDLNDTIV